MLFVIGSLVVIGSVVGGFVALGGHLDVLWQPFEFLIIGGAGVGAFLIGNSGTVLKGILTCIRKMLPRLKAERFTVEVCISTGNTVIWG